MRFPDRLWCFRFTVKTKHGSEVGFSTERSVASRDSFLAHLKLHNDVYSDIGVREYISKED